LNNSRLILVVHGAVQGVGFRPFIFRLASELGLKGWVNNSAQGVFIEVEGPRSAAENFLLRVEKEKPPRSFIQGLEARWLDPVGYDSFEIRHSVSGGSKTALILPDIATCQDCLNDIFTPGNRRYFYAFTNCTNCGPRFSIIESLPYDRANTSMRGFTMCPACQAEYENPLDRRFHAQPNACPVCGPQLELWDGSGHSVFQASPDDPARSSAALHAAADALRAGRIVAVKGLGGFHLMVAAENDLAVRRLRELKHREEKPFALMFPSLTTVGDVCEFSPLEQRLLCSAESPIVLLRRRQGSALGPEAPALSAAVAPGNPSLGVMLPYTPLHHLLMSLLGRPVVATSGNISDEPICIDEREALVRLAGIAELFLVHNRPIVRHVDDSVARIMAGRELVLRRARGFAPMPVRIEFQNPQPRKVLAVGAHLKNAVALGLGPEVFVSQHIGDLETEAAFQAFRRVIEDFERLYEARPDVVVADAHPDYLSTQFARNLAGSEKPPHFLSVQHHMAHVLSCMAENEVRAPALGVAWDGTGYGLDGTVWGGEFFLVEPDSCIRFAHFRQFRLPGGEQAIKEPRRAALGLLFEVFGEESFAHPSVVQAFSGSELAPLATMLRRGLNSPLTSSAGRLFDAIASIVGLRQVVRFEGQAAMELEFALEGVTTSEHYDCILSSPAQTERTEASGSAPPLVLDWAPLLKGVLADLSRGTARGEIAAKFHNCLVEAVVAVARRAGRERVLLSGGCFQNRYLTETMVRRLGEAGFRPYWHQRVPPNDGGIALGQVMALWR
jgi:hydrogenase maturation protein HypF